MVAIKPNIVYDTSLLLAKTQRKLLEKMLRYYWISRVNNPQTQWLMIFLEEAQVHLKNIRGETAQQILRVCTSGRNLKIRCCSIVVDLSLIDTIFIRLSSQRYHFKLPLEQGAKTKFKSMDGKEATETATRLKVGECYYVNNDSMELLKIPSHRIGFEYPSQDNNGITLACRSPPRKFFFRTTNNLLSQNSS